MWLMEKQRNAPLEVVLEHQSEEPFPWSLPSVVDDDDAEDDQMPCSLRADVVVHPLRMRRPRDAAIVGCPLV